MMILIISDVQNDADYLFMVFQTLYKLSFCSVKFFSCVCVCVANARTHAHTHRHTPFFLGKIIDTTAKTCYLYAFKVVFVLKWHVMMKRKHESKCQRESLINYSNFRMLPNDWGQDVESN